MKVEFCFENGDVIEVLFAKDAGVDHIVDTGASIAKVNNTKLEDWFEVKEG